MPDLSTGQKVAVVVTASAIIALGLWRVYLRQKIKQTSKAMSNNDENDSNEKKIVTANACRIEGNKQYKAGRFDEAIRYYSQAIQLYPRQSTDLSLAYSNRAAAYISKQDFQAALIDCNDALRLNSKFVKALDRRARVYENIDRLEEALEDAVAALVIDEMKNESYFGHIEHLLSKIGESKAKNLYQNRKHSLESKWVITRFLRSFRREWNSLQIQRESYLAEFFGEIAIQSYDTAYKLIQNISMQKEEPQVLNWLGTFHFLAGDFKTAKVVLKKSISQDPNYVATRIKYALVLMELGQYVEMTESLEAAQKIDDTDPSIYYHRGEIFALSSNLEAAIADFSRAIQLDAEFVDAYVHQSRAYLAMELPIVAREFLSKALKLFPDEPEVLHALGECWAIEGQREKALELFEKVERMAPQFPQVTLNKAVIQYIQDDSNDAFGQQLCHIVEKFPYFDAAHVQLAGHLISKKKTVEAMIHYDIAAQHARSYQELVTICTLRAISQAQAQVAEKYPELASSIQ